MNNFDYLYNPAAAKQTFDKDYFVDKKLEFQVIERGMILPFKRIEKFDGGGVVHSNGEYVKESFIHHGIGGAYTSPRINSTQQ